MEGPDVLKISFRLAPVKGGARLESYVAKVQDRELSIRYQKDCVTISIVACAKRSADENQLMLFDFDLNSMKDHATTE